MQPCTWFSALAMLTIGPMSPTTVILCSVTFFLLSTLTSATSAK